MKFPSNELIAFQIMLHLYHHYKKNQTGMTPKEVYKILAIVFDITQEQLDRTVKSGGEPLWNNTVRQAKRQIAEENLVYSSREGYWMISHKGIKVYEKLREHTN